MLVCVSIDIDTISVHFRYNLVNNGLVHQISHVFKMCIDYKCQSFDDLGISVSCPSVNNEECAGKGVSN